MKKIAIFLTLAFVFGMTIPANAQVDETKKAVKTASKKTNRGLHKGWSKGKRIGKKSWVKGKRGTKKGVKAVKSAIK